MAPRNIAPDYKQTRRPPLRLIFGGIFPQNRSLVFYAGGVAFQSGDKTPVRTQQEYILHAINLPAGQFKNQISHTRAPFLFYES